MRIAFYLKEGKMSKKLQELKESFVETWFLVEACLTSFWFWLPILYAAWFFIQLWMIFFIHPLTIFILPAILSVYSILQEEERLKLQYGVDKKKTLGALHPIGAGPQELKDFGWDIENLWKSKEEQKLKKNHEE